MKYIKYILFLLFFIPVVLKADGFIVLDPIPYTVPLSVRYHYVDIDIDNQMAKISIDQVFVNNNDYEVEGTYIFPIPRDATINNFAMYIDNKLINGELLAKDEARKIYEKKVIELIDPALLEYIGTGMYKTKIFPIGPGEEKRVKLEYTQLINKNYNTYNFLYPLNTEKFSSEKLEEVKIQVSINHNRNIKNIYSPTHDIEITRDNDTQAEIVYEEKDIIPKIDFELFFTEDENDVGIDLLTYKEKNRDGYFMVLASPKVDFKKEDKLPKEIVFVIDKSGSMVGDKIDQAKNALIYCLKKLKQDNFNNIDRYNIVNFSDTTDLYKDTLQIPDNIDEAISFVEDIEAIGGTNINEALERTLSLFSDQNKSKLLIFLTDGEPTVGEIDMSTIVKNIKDSNTLGVKIFVFGVGDDVNTHLLDFISGDSKALSTYVKEDESIESKISSFYDKISYPFLRNISIDISKEIGIYDIYPKYLPDIYKGSELVVLGRYKNQGESLISINGEYIDINKGYSIKSQFDDFNTGYSYLPSLWASRKIGYLMDQIRLYGDTSNELRESIINLSKDYGIITEYTSFLIDLPEENFIDNALDRLEDNLQDFGAYTGESAQKSVLSTQTLQRTLNISSNRILDTEKEGMVRKINNKIFYYNNGVWVDNDFIEDTAKEIGYGTADYFKLIDLDVVNAKYLSLGKKVDFCNKDKCYQIIENDLSNINNFIDVDENHFAYDIINEMYELGIISGYQNIYFKPNNPITRAEFLSILIKYFDIPIDTSTNIYFEDIKKN